MDNAAITPPGGDELKGETSLNLGRGKSHSGVRTSANAITPNDLEYTFLF